MLNGKKLAEELDENNQKQQQNIDGKFLYYARAIDPAVQIDSQNINSETDHTVFELQLVTSRGNDRI